MEILQGASFGVKGDLLGVTAFDGNSKNLLGSGSVGIEEDEFSILRDLGGIIGSRMVGEPAGSPPLRELAQMSPAQAKTRVLELGEMAALEGSLISPMPKATPPAMREAEMKHAPRLQRRGEKYRGSEELFIRSIAGRCFVFLKSQG